MEGQKDEFALRLYTGYYNRKQPKKCVEFQVNNIGRCRHVNKAFERDGDASEIKKEVQFGNIVVEHLKCMIRDSGILDVTGERWPKPEFEKGRHEIEIIVDGKHLWLETIEFVSASDLGDLEAQDRDNLSKFLSLSDDLKEFLLSLINKYFKKNPFG